ncbi:hypothetical protein C2845_PM05G23350 [Panicum miliaceum]|uniref:Reverse transcriptase zinc-binding domain-containing protein n=1 Tax=Panicum miliaceum TaxID=4540 RepID=A0A3L6SXI1_PANMI|nr:hypothetical protein C2845_PM05G23350 [Panicum miliaceum]
MHCHQSKPSSAQSLNEPTSKKLHLQRPQIVYKPNNLKFGDICWFCDQEPETCDHILVNSTFANQVWWDAVSALDCTCSFSRSQLTLREWWTHCRQLQVKERRKDFDTLFMLIAWLLWKEWNDRLFDRRLSTTDQLLETVKTEVRLWVEAGARRLGCLKRE